MMVEHRSLLAWNSLSLDEVDFMLRKMNNSNKLFSAVVTLTKHPQMSVAVPPERGGVGFGNT